LLEIPNPGYITLQSFKDEDPVENALIKDNMI